MALILEAGPFSLIRWFLLIFSPTVVIAINKGLFIDVAYHHIQITIVVKICISGTTAVAWQYFCTAILASVNFKSSPCTKILFSSLSSGILRMRSSSFESTHCAGSSIASPDPKQS